MSVIVSCACGWRQALDDEHEGRRGRCPRCGGAVLVPLAERSGVATSAGRRWTIGTLIVAGVTALFFVVREVVQESRRIDAMRAEADALSSREPTDPVALGRAYRENEIAADRRYKGMLLTVRGRVGSIRSSEFISKSGHFVIETPVGTEDIHCEFPAERLDDLLPLRPGSEVVVQGRCDGKGPLGGVFLKDCRLLK